MATLRVPGLRAGALARSLSSSAARHADKQSANPFAHLNSRHNDTAAEYRRFMKTKPLNPHLTNTTSTIANALPSVGADKPPADQLSSVDPAYVPKDSVPENTARMTGGTQTAKPQKGPNAELDVGEIEGGVFKVDPYRREGEHVQTTRARLLYQSRKRGTLESDLLLGHFANKYLDVMTPAQLHQYDLFLDENDWDIYYWATQEPVPTSAETAEGGSAEWATAAAQGKDSKTRAKAGPAEADAGKTNAEATGASTPAPTPVKPGVGEWAQTVGTFKPKYRPVPARWKGSEILALLRRHVKENSAGGVLGDIDVDGDVAEAGSADSETSSSGSGSGKGQGLGFMPTLRPVRHEQKA